MVVLRVNEIRVLCPTRWAEVTTATFLKIFKEWEPEKPIELRNRVKLFSILTGTNFEKVSQSEDYALEAAIYQCTEFVYTEQIDFQALPVPEFVEINDVRIKIPKNVGSLTIGQNMQVRQAINEHKDELSTIATVTAIYLQPFYDAAPKDGKMVNADFDPEKAQELEALVLSQPITTIYPIGFFLLKKLAASGTNSVGRWLRKIQQKANGVAVSLNLLRPKSSTVYLKSR